MENNNQEVPFNVEVYKAILIAKYRALVGAINTD